jgi:enoyl-CoA hydratase/carnithine racemase
MMNEGSYTTIDYSVDDGILTITLSRPDQLNAFTVTMADELEDAFGRAGADDSVAAVVVTGAGRAFCAGMDLTVGGNVFGLDESRCPELETAADPGELALADGVRDTGGRVSLAIYHCPKPVIGAINGAAVGVGATMTLAMDARLASDKARIGFVFGRLGIVCEACSSWFLPRIVGQAQALDWLYSADIFTAEEARAGGLVRSVHAPGDLLPAAYALARRWTANRSPAGTALIRGMIYRNSAEPEPLPAHQVESLAMLYTSAGDGKEGVQAFLEKRSPNFASPAPTAWELLARWRGEDKRG